MPKQPNHHYIPIFDLKQWAAGQYRKERPNSIGLTVGARGGEADRATGTGAFVLKA